jgi:hypothetical protein
LTRRGLLLPREHGAYAEIAFPVLTGLTLGHPTAVSICLAVSATAFFVLYEPLAVLTGVRGRRVKEQWGGQAKERVPLLAILGIVAGTVALTSADAELRLAALAPLGAGGALLPAFLSGKLKTLATEILVIAALSGVVLPMAISNGVAWPLAWAASAVWFVTFLLGTLAVHAIKARTGKKLGARWTVVVTPALSAIVAVFGLIAALSNWLPLTVSLAFSVSGVVGAVLSMIPVHPRHMKRVGWTLVSSNFVTWWLLLAA